MNLNEALNRTTNLVAVSVVALAGFAFLPEVFIEDKLIYKVDDAVLFLIGVRAVWWYRTGKNNVSRSIMPIILLIGGLAWKIFAIIFEFREADDVGDDFGGLILFVCASILAIMLYKGVTSLAKSTPTKH